jgi:hypothetical protein
MKIIASYTTGTNGELCHADDGRPVCPRRRQRQRGDRDGWERSGPAFARRYTHASGAVVEHCGHGTALYPYQAWTPDGREIRRHNGGTFALLVEAQTAIELELEQLPHNARHRRHQQPPAVGAGGTDPRPRHVAAAIQANDFHAEQQPAHTPPPHQGANAEAEEQ